MAISCPDRCPYSGRGACPVHDPHWTSNRGRLGASSGGTLLGVIIGLAHLFFLVFVVPLIGVYGWGSTLFEGDLDWDGAFGLFFALCASSIPILLLFLVFGPRPEVKPVARYLMGLSPKATLGLTLAYVVVVMCTWGYLGAAGQDRLPQSSGPMRFARAVLRALAYVSATLASILFIPAFFSYKAGASGTSLLAVVAMILGISVVLFSLGWLWDEPSGWRTTLVLVEVAVIGSLFVFRDVARRSLPLPITVQTLLTDLGIGDATPPGAQTFPAWAGWEGAGEYDFAAAGYTTPYLTAQSQLDNWNYVIYGTPRVENGNTRPVAPEIEALTPAQRTAISDGDYKPRLRTSRGRLFRLPTST